MPCRTAIIRYSFLPLFFMFFAFTSCDNKEGDAEEEVVDYPFLGTWRRVSVENRGCSNDAINGLKVMNCPNDSECVELTFNEDGTYVSYYVQDGQRFLAGSLFLRAPIA